MKRAHYFPPVPLLLSLLLLVACQTLQPAATPTVILPTSTPEFNSPIATPTPESLALQVPLQRYQAENGSFVIQVPAGWSAEDIGGGMRFQSPRGPTDLTVHFEVLPVTTSPDTYVSQVISQTIEAMVEVNPDGVEIIQQGRENGGHFHFEAIGKLASDEPTARLRSELWTEHGALLGLTLRAPVDQWEDVDPLWPILRQSYTPERIQETIAGMVLPYVHPSELFSTTVPVNWGIVDETEYGVLFSDVSGTAQFAIDATQWDHVASGNELKQILLDSLIDLPEQEHFSKLRDDSISDSGHVLQFEHLVEGDGFQRTELRSLRNGLLLFTTSYSVPPQDWELFHPAYDKMLSSLQLAEYTPLSEEAQDQDPILGVDVGEVMFYVDRDERLWVSAPIYNGRTRHLGDITAAINLFHADGSLLGAESWRLQQKVVPSGGFTVLTQRLPTNVADPSSVETVSVVIVDAKDTDRETQPAWGFEGGEANVNNNGDLVLEVKMRNAGNSNRSNIYLVALLYDEDGELVFAKAQTKRVGASIRPGQTADLRMEIKGPLTNIVSFDMVGEVPR